uniref:Uncharacterized protein n=1 Tax=Anguilla anguilla TaxID=7936 RepID=A0A0E9XEU2_ANGAN
MTMNSPFIIQLLIIGKYYFSLLTFTR